jgi:RNA polymerase sigma factor (sigma-70 family)
VRLEQVEQSDAALVAACRRGEAAALGVLVERYQRDVFGAALRLCRDRDAALELTNTVFYKAYQHLESYDASRPLRPWLLRIASNETLNWLRSRKREREHELDGEARDVAFEQIAGGEEPEVAALRLEQRELVRAALAQLPEHYRLVLTLRFFNDLSYGEIAEITGQDANTVGVQLLRARTLLKTAIGRMDGGVAAARQDKGTTPAPQPSGGSTIAQHRGMTRP